MQTNAQKIQEYEEISNINFSLKAIKQKFHEELYAHGIPETQITLVTAKENQEYLGQYSSNSQFKDGFKSYIHIGNIVTATEIAYLNDNDEKTLKTLTTKDKIQIAQLIEKNTLDTLWHEYAHAIYESLNESEIYQQFFHDLNIFFDHDEEEFAEAFCQLYSGKDKATILELAEQPLNVEISILNQATQNFVEENFFPQNADDCSNPNRKQFFIKDCFIEGFPQEAKYNINGEYDKKVHEAFLKNEIRILEGSFKNHFEVVHINTEERGKYPLIKIGNPGNETQNFLFLDSVGTDTQLKKDKNTYSFDEISSILIVPQAKKSLK